MSLLLMHSRTKSLFAQSLAIARNEIIILLRDPLNYMTMMAMPLVVMAFLNATYQAALSSTGPADSIGSTHSVPAMTAMFSLLFMANVGFLFFREHGWNTWERLRLGVSGDSALVIGKLLPAYLFCLIQVTATFYLGALLFDLHIAGSPLAIFVTHLVLTSVVVSLGLLLASFCRSVMQVNAICNIATLVLGGVGGAFTPAEVMSPLMQSVASLTPLYWVIDSYKATVFDVSTPWIGWFLLLSMAVVATALFLWRLDFEEQKIFWS